MVPGFIFGVVSTLLVLWVGRSVAQRRARKRSQGMMRLMYERRNNFVDFAQYMFSTKGVFLSDLPQAVSKGLEEALTVTELTIRHHWHPEIKDASDTHTLFIELSDPFESYEIQRTGDLKYEQFELESKKGFRLEVEPLQDYARMSLIRILVTTRGPMGQKPKVRSIPEKVMIDAMEEVVLGS